MRQSKKQLRIALYTHDTFGLGHVRRCLTIARALHEKLPQAAILLITGSPAKDIFKELPQNVDYVKIPTVVKTGTRDMQPPHIPLSVKEVTTLRTRIIKESVLGFMPDLFLVDNFPLGSRRELLPVLQVVKKAGIKTVLGLRDILDAPDVVCTDWKKLGMYDVLERYYDKILVYGNKSIFNPVTAYAFTETIAAKVRYCGYVTSRSEKAYTSQKARAVLGVNRPFVLVSGGGGGDAYPLLRTYVDAIDRLPKGIASVIITGPLMGGADKNALRKKIANKPTVVMHDFVPNVSLCFKAAAALVTMCGYNSSTEILSHDAHALVVPRTWKYGEHKNRFGTTSEGEQVMRARALGKRGYMEVIEPDQLCADRVATTLTSMLKKGRRAPSRPIAIKGIQRTVAEIIQTLHR